MRNTHRRQLLGKLAASVPLAWTAPVIQSVSLPAHARFTCDSLVDTIAGETVACSSGTSRCVEYDYALANGCLQRQEFSCDPDGPSEASAPNRLRIRQTWESDRVFFAIATPTQVYFQSQLCNPPFSASNLNPAALLMRIGNVDYWALVSGGRTETPGTVFFNDIVIQPAS